MSSDVMVRDFPEQEQRAAVCHRQWRERGKQVELLMDSEVEITEEDVIRARAYWRRLLPRRFRDLLDARAE